MIASLFGGVHDFFHSGTWDAIRTIGILFVIVLWAATVYWVWKDARRRISEPVLIGLATIVGAVPPFLGPLVYMLFRPPEYLEDVRERQLEIRAIEKRLAERGEECSVCGAEVGSDYLVCPVCTTRLRQACTSCSKPLQPAWQVCPYCETPIDHDPGTVQLAEAQRPQRRQRTR